GLRHEAQRLEQENVLSGAEVALLDLDAVAAFWSSDFGRRVLEHSAFVRRELRFTAQFRAAELARISDEPVEPALEGESVVVQGVADLAVILPKEIWLIDFKTESLTATDLAARTKLYEPQLELYARALSD